MPQPIGYCNNSEYHLSPAQLREYRRHIRFIQANNFWTSIIGSSGLPESLGNSIIVMWRWDADRKTKFNHTRIEAPGLMEVVRAASFYAGKVVAVEKKVGYKLNEFEVVFPNQQRGVK